MASLSLYLKGTELDATEFRLGLGAPIVRASSSDPRLPWIQNRAGIDSWVALLAEQSSWFYEDPKWAVKDLLEAMEAGREVAATAPLFSGGRKSIAATVAELIRARRNDSVDHIFGESNEVFFIDAFRSKCRPPLAWLTVKLPQSNIRIYVDGELVADPRRLKALARDIELSRPKLWTPRDI